MLGWVADVERATLDNTNFRTVLFTGEHTQLTVMRIEAGEGELSCVVPNLSLVPGLYMLRAAVHEASSNVRLAGCGWTRPGLIFKVEAAPGLLTNAQMQIGQLVVTDVDWGRR